MRAGEPSDLASPNFDTRPCHTHKEVANWNPAYFPLYEKARLRISLGLSWCLMSVSVSGCAADDQRAGSQQQLPLPRLIRPSHRLLSR